MIITLGNQPADEDGASIYDLSANGTLAHEFTLNEQGAHDIHHHSTGEIVVVGTDPTDDWSLGNLYVKQSGVWSKKRTIPNGIHSWGATEHNGLLYVATSNHTGDNATWVGQVWWSDDFGDTWAGHADITTYRVYDIISFAGKLYATSTTYTFHTLKVSLDNGETWSEVDDVIPVLRPRMAIYKDSLLVSGQNVRGFMCVDTVGNVSRLLAADNIGLANVYNSSVVLGDNLYVLCGRVGTQGADRIYRYDGSTWYYHCDLGEACISLLNFEDEFLIASTVGVGAKILRIPL